MTYVLELKPEVARKLEERAARKGVAPAEIVEELLTEQAPEIEYFEMDEVRAMAEKLFDDRASVYEALAEGAK